MPTLLIRLAAPLQSWGTSSRFSTRGTDAAPSKSGVIGLLAAALGIPRDGSLERFAGLRFGTRTDVAGTVADDFQTAVGLEDPQRRMPLLHKHYLADAVFVAGIESDDRALLQEFRQALRAPHYPLFLGRRSCPPDGPLTTWLEDDGLEQALRDLPWQGNAETLLRQRRGAVPDTLSLPLVIEGSGDDGAFSEFVNDEPVSFSSERRVYSGRTVHRPVPVRLPFSAASARTGDDAREGAPAPSGADHDPMSAFLEEDNA